MIHYDYLFNQEILVNFPTKAPEDPSLCIDLLYCSVCLDNIKEDDELQESITFRAFQALFDDIAKKANTPDYHIFRKYTIKKRLKENMPKIIKLWCQEKIEPSSYGLIHADHIRITEKDREELYNFMLSDDYALLSIYDYVRLPEEEGARTIGAIKGASICHRCEHKTTTHEEVMLCEKCGTLMQNMPKS
jgi:hypothetical protein